MTSPSPFTWRHVEPDISVCGVRWSLRDALSDRDGEALMFDWGLWVGHTTGLRWVPRDAPELDTRCHPHRTPTTASYRGEETDTKIKQGWHEISRAGDAEGQTLDCLLCPLRDATAATQFFRKVLRARDTVTPRVIPVDQHAASP